MWDFPLLHFCWSLSARRAWIEISASGPRATASGWSLSARRAWIEMRVIVRLQPAHFPSLSARRAWIEILFDRRRCRECWVALRKESVDRNTFNSYTIDNKSRVALRKESVDRNYKPVLLQRLEVGRSPQGERG